MQQASLKIALNLALWALIFIISTEGYNVTARDKRDSDDDGDNNDELEADILKVKYYYEGRVESVHLREVTDSTLASALLPVRNINEHGVVSDEHKLYEDSLDGPIFYHGVNSFSALSYFPRTRTLHGVLDQKFFVENLPLRDADNPDLVKSFITLIPAELNKLKKRTCPEPRNRIRRMTNKNDNKRKNDESPDISPNKKSKVDHGKKKVYPEIFLIVDVSPLRINTTLQNKFEKAIMHVLAYWNAVDMLYRNLKRIDVRINIAGMLVGEKEHLVNSLITKPGHVRIRGERTFLSSEKALEDLGTFFHYQDMTKRDSYDFLIWMTSATLVNAENWYQEIDEFDNRMKKKEYIAVAAPGNCGGMHYDEIRNRKISNRAIVMYDDKYAQYHIAARGLAHLMFVPHDDAEVLHDKHYSNCLSPNPMTHSSGIMDLHNRKAEGYLFWSYCSEIHFEIYSRSKSACCLFNYPSRTINFFEYHIMSIKSQCECYGQQRLNKKFYERDICAEPLVCKNAKDQMLLVGLPLDGSPCGQGSKNHRSFCNHNECV